MWQIKLRMFLFEVPSKSNSVLNNFEKSYNLGQVITSYLIQATTFYLVQAATFYLVQTTTFYLVRTITLILDEISQDTTF